VKQAYDILQKPVLVEDVSLEFNALSGLPGPFIKFFVDGPGLDITARMLDGYSDRSAIARCTFGYFDGSDIRLFRGSLEG
jgi:inosine triphosphate pyrophosphatase